jgi:hypothetical protein
MVHKAYNTTGVGAYTDYYCTTSAGTYVGSIPF